VLFDGPKGVELLGFQLQQVVQEGRRLYVGENPSGRTRS
jgi:hypothetical protein